jgi:hypothetical protein
VLDETTGRWGIKVTRVEIKAIEPPPSIRDSMEKQMRAERERRATILNAEGHKQSQILTAEGEKQAAVLRAEGDRTSRILQAEGQAKAIKTVFDAIHTADPNPQVLAYQYMQALPQIAAGQSNKVWIIPAELTRALEGIGGALGGLTGMGAVPGTERPEMEATAAEIEAAHDVEAAAEEARAAASSAADAAKEASAAASSPAVPGVPAPAATKPAATKPATSAGDGAEPPTVETAKPTSEETQQIGASPHASLGNLLDDETQRIPIR